MPSITSWARIEPRARTSDYEKAMQARTRDPLWLLGRQWQFGEFRGDDAGWPVIAQVGTESSRLGRYRPGYLASGASGSGQFYDSATMPLEALVERETSRLDTQTLDARDRRRDAEAGLHFLRMLASKNLGGYRSAYLALYPFPKLGDEERAVLDGGSQRFFDLLAARVPDGAALYKDLKAALYPSGSTPGALPSKPAMKSSTDASAVKSIALTWLSWYESLVTEAAASTTTAWNPERMEYEFSVSAPDINKQEVVLGAAEYAGGSLDWHAFVQKPGAKLGAAGVSEKVTKTIPPTPLTFPGMPARRFWELEDGRLDFGSVKVSREDLGRLMMIEFALAYGNDWFVVPIELAVGSLSRVTALTVTDTFGVQTSVRHYTSVDGSDTSWRMFSVPADPRATSGTAVADLFFLPPALGKGMQGGPVEEVLFLRDEMANMAWAVERLVESPAGLPVDRHAAYQEKRGREVGPAPPPPAQGTKVRYVLATSVPEHWIPLLPWRADAGSPLRLKRAAMLDAKEQAILPRGRILQPEVELSLYDEEVPREGARVTRAYQYTRWVNGSTYLWVGRRKQSGRGEGSSGLRFDSLDPI